MTCCWQVEIDPFCQKVLTKHWPNVRRYEDVRDCGKHNLAPVDLIAGGFPCQETSIAAEIQHRRIGLDGPRSGLWSEYLRIVWELRPTWVIVENPPGIKKWACEIEAGLERAGYRVSRTELSAEDFGAPHQRRRVYFIANSVRIGCNTLAGVGGPPQTIATPWPSPPGGTWNETARRSCGVDDGVFSRVDRLRALGNAAVPQVVEWIGRQILETTRLCDYQ